MPILVVRLWRSFFYKIKMIKHFFKRLLIVIITFAVVFLLGFLFIITTSGNAALGILYLMIYATLFVIVAVVLGLILDSIILYRRKEKDKASESLLVLFILLLTIFLAITITFS